MYTPSIRLFDTISQKAVDVTANQVAVDVFFGTVLEMLGWFEAVDSKNQKNIAAIKWNKVRAWVIFLCKGVLQEYNISAVQPLYFSSTKPGLDFWPLSQVFDRHAQP